MYVEFSETRRTRFGFIQKLKITPKPIPGLFGLKLPKRQMDKPEIQLDIVPGI
jgi:hypothetical protein